MKRSILSILCIITIHLSVTAKPCPGNFIFNTQAAIDAFPATYPGCTTITGNVTIQGSAINNLNGLAQITSIGGFPLDLKAPDPGMLRETFFISQAKSRYTVEYAEEGDFWVDKRYTIEVGGRRKGYSQIQNTVDAYIAADQLEVGIDRKIPLWLFGFLY